MLPRALLRDADGARCPLRRRHGACLRGGCTSDGPAGQLAPRVAGPRPPAAARPGTHLHAGHLAGAVIAGDFNAIQPFDATLNSDNGLGDAYLELGGQEGGEDGFTWGQQAPPALRQQFGCSRMDKAYFCGSGIKLQDFERFGADVEVGWGNKKQRDGLLALGFEKAWVTDHLGIKTTFSLVNDTRL